MKQMTQEQFEAKVKDLHPTLTITSEYRSTNHDISYHCNTCQHEDTMKAGNMIYQFQGCKRCNLKTRKKRVLATDKFLEKVAIAHPTLTITSEYRGVMGKVGYHCNVCGHDGEKSVNALLYAPVRQGCSHCSKSSGGIGGLNAHSEEKLKIRGITGGRFYVAHLTNESGVNCYKIGITTQTFAARAMNFRFLSKCKVEKVYEIFAMSHSDLVLIESIFKQTHKDSRYDWVKKWFGSAECFVFGSHEEAIAAAEAAVGHALKLIEEIG